MWPRHAAEFPGLRPPRHASTFPDVKMAEVALGSLVKEHEDEVAAWLAGSHERLCLVDTAPVVVGRCMDRSGALSDVHGVHAVLVRQPSMPEGWLLFTGYPRHEPRRGHTDVPALAQLMGAYFHQDWDDDIGDEAAIVRAFTRSAPDLAAALPAEIARVLAAYPDETDLEAFLDDLGCEFTLRCGEGGYAGWLRSIARRSGGPLP
jgi:hypothetical protein